MDFSAIPWSKLAPFIAAGFCAQLVDGAFGLAFGFISNACLVILGVPLPAAAAAVRTVESFTSGVSGLAHGLAGNIDWPLFARLSVAGIVGGLLGVWTLMHLHHEALRPVMLIYLTAIGVYLIWRGPRRPQGYRRIRFVVPAGIAGGFLDASGSGGWGPVVVGHLLAQGATPRIAIGTVNAAEFFVTVTVLAAFVGSIGYEAFTVATSGLMIGGLLAAPVGALLVRKLRPRTLVVVAGILLATVGLYGILALAVEPLPVFPRY